MAKKQFDIGMVDDDLDTQAGDFTVVESTREHQVQLTANNKGDFKENPDICVGAAMYLDDDNGFQALAAEIARQFSLDGMDVESIKIAADGRIESKAQYK